MEDPTEKIVEEALTLAGVSFERGAQPGDLYLTDYGVKVMVKQFHLGSAIRQIVGLPDDALLIQGWGAAQTLSLLLRPRPRAWSTDLKTLPRVEGKTVLAYCLHPTGDEYFGDDPKRLPPYAAHAEGLGHAENGLNLISWRDSWVEDEGVMPGWWFTTTDDPGMPAYPIAWLGIPDFTPPTPVPAPLGAELRWLSMESAPRVGLRPVLLRRHLGPVRQHPPLVVVAVWYGGELGWVNSADQRDINIVADGWCPLPLEEKAP